MAPEDRARLLKNTRRMMDDKLPPQEYQVVMKDGRMVSFEVHGEVLRDADLTPLGFVYVCRDMTERKKMYEMLFQSEEKFSKIFMTTPECIAITRLADGEVVDVNRGFEEITGWKRSEAIGRTTWDTNIWLEASARERMVQDLQTGLDVRHREFQFRRSDGSVRTGIYSARPIHIAGEACVIFIFQDITDQRQLEEERQKLEQQLIQSQKAEAIGTLAGGIAHDFNNILGVIIGYTELAAMQPEVSAMQRYQERVLNACERAKSLVRQILTFARHTESERNPLDLRLLAKESLKLLDSTIPATIEIRQQIADRAYTINGDPTQMHQILMNLCTNAVHAMGEKGGVLEVGLSHEDFTDGTAQQIPGLKPGPYVRLAVSDTGEGIDPAIMDRIFDPFFTTKSVDKGTGLGLSVVYGIVRNHDGAVTATSRPGEGTTFTVYIPDAGKTGPAQTGLASDPAPRPKRQRTHPPRGRRKDPGGTRQGDALLPGIRSDGLYGQQEGARGLPIRSQSVRSGRHRHDHAAHDGKGSGQRAACHPGGHPHYRLHGIQRIYRQRQGGPAGDPGIAPEARLEKRSGQNHPGNARSRQGRTVRRDGRTSIGKGDAPRAGKPLAVLFCRTITVFPYDPRLPGTPSIFQHTGKADHFLQSPPGTDVDIKTA